MLNNITFHKFKGYGWRVALGGKEYSISMEVLTKTEHQNGEER